MPNINTSSKRKEPGFMGYTHVESFHKVYQAATRLGNLAGHNLDVPIPFRGTVKLHGTNASVICTAESLVAQSRHRRLALDSDNYGWAAWVSKENVAKAIREIEREIRESQGLDDKDSVVLFGELIGPGIQAGMAISKLPKRQWVLFGVATNRLGTKYLDAVPRLNNQYAELGIYSIMDLETVKIDIDFSDREQIEEVLGKVNRMVEKVEAACPWGQRFGIDGIGEGLVFIPIGNRWGQSWLYWKAKGEKHKKVKTKRRIQIDPEILASINDFVDFSVTDGRLAQGIEVLREEQHEMAMTSMGEFLRWVGQDVKRECSAVLEASGLEWKQVGKAVNAKALEFFKSYLDGIQ